MNKIIVIVGPTGVGKTKLSIKLAKIYGGEIINADSMQIYKGLDIGTAKITKEEKKGIKHHLLDIKEVTDDYSVYDYQKDCRLKITEILNKNKLPIIVGGTGLYIKAALYNYDFILSKEKDNLYEDLSNEEIYNKIKEFGYNDKIDQNNRRRLVRLLNKIEKDLMILPNDLNLIYNNVIFIGLKAPSKDLYERIDRRVDEMLIDLVDEVKHFYDRGIYSKSLMTGIGYKELYEFFENKKSFKEAVNEIKQNSRNYAKRQYTWFNNQMNIKWFDTNFNDFDQTVNKIIDYLNSK